jgi:dihydropyrimidinase
MDLGILNGNVYIDGVTYEENLYIKNGKIDTITKSFLPCKKEIDAKDKLILPGFIDPHTHFHLTVGANTSKDDFYQGSINGALGGVTTYIDFLDTIKQVEQFDKAFNSRRTLAKNSATDYSFHTTIANPTDEASKMLKAGLNVGIPSLKLFTTYSNTDRRTFDYYIDDLLRESKELKSRIVIHAENDHMIKTNPDILIKDHEKSRPVISERTEIIKLAEIAKERDGLLYIVHVSAGSSVESLVLNYKKQLVDRNILLESCPHYFLFNSDVYGGEEGYKYTMTPPLREEKERQLIREHFEDFTVIATDHCPFELSLKKKDFTSSIPMGVGSIRYSFATMYSQYGRKVIPKFTDGPAKAYGLFPRKGHLMPGADADVVIFDENIRENIYDLESIYHGMEVKGKIMDVLLRGKQIIKEGTFVGGNGEFIERRINL